MGHVIKKIQGETYAFRPCPFCGGFPEWVVIPGEDFIMRCTVCHASTQKAYWTPAHAVRAWNAGRIEDDHYAVTEDTRIEDLLSCKIEKILFSEYSNIEAFPEEEGGFLCSEAVIVTDKMLLLLEPEKAHLLYDELSGYGTTYFTKPISEDKGEIRLVEAEWQKDRILSLVFACADKTVTISACAEKDCMLVREGV